jgi:cell division septum initiation protein DivIVA
MQIVVPLCFQEKLKMKKIILIGIIIVFIISLGYFAFRFHDLAFRDAAMGNLFATMLGLIIGIPIGLEINRRQQEEIEKLQKDKERERRLKEFALSFDRLDDELLTNEKKLEVLSNTLPMASSARLDMWKLASAIVDSFSFEAYNDFYNAGFYTLLSDRIEAKIYTSYNELRRLFHNVKVAVHLHAFYYGFSGDEKKANMLFDQIIKDVESLQAKVDKTLDEIAEYRQQVNFKYERHNPASS